MSESLYTTSDVKQIRELLVKQQNGFDPILKELFRETVVTDHDHDTQHIRAALNRNTNAFEGRVVNSYKRCLKWLTDVPLPVILRNLADYLEQDYSHMPYHPHWQKKITTMFNSLTSKQQQQVIEQLGSTECCTNATQRKKVFSKLLKCRNLGYTKILSAINQSKGV